jgi:hypothetical protein
MEMRFTAILKLLLVVVVGLFILKLASKYLVTKFPNAVTNSVDTVVQAA